MFKLHKFSEINSLDCRLLQYELFIICYNIILYYICPIHQCGVEMKLSAVLMEPRLDRVCGEMPVRAELNTGIYRTYSTENKYTYITPLYDIL